MPPCLPKFRSSEAWKHRADSLIDLVRGWVLNLHRALEICVAQFLGKEPRIWRDPKLQENDYYVR